MFLASSSSSSSSGSGAAGRAPAARRLAAARAATITANEDRNARTCTGCNLTFHVDHFSPDQLRRGGTRKTEPGSTGGKSCPCLFQIRPPRTDGGLRAGFECAAAAAAAAAAAVEEEENEGDDDISRNSLT